MFLINCSLHTIFFNIKKFANYFFDEILWLSYKIKDTDNFLEVIRDNYRNRRRIKIEKVTKTLKNYIKVILI